MWFYDRDFSIETSDMHLKYADRMTSSADPEEQADLGYWLLCADI